jgi:Arylsulfotransferase (ASST)/FlgD Ig-like domain
MKRPHAPAVLSALLGCAAVLTLAAPAAPAPLPPHRGAPLVLPEDFPDLHITTVDHPDAGYLFLAKESGNSRYLMILDNDGFPAYFRSSVGLVRDFKKQPNGLLTFYDRSSAPGVFVAMDSTYSVVDQWSPGAGFSEIDSHDFQILPNGHVLLFYYDAQPVDMSAIVSGGDPKAVVTGLVIRELDAAHNVVFEWESWDHYSITDAATLDLTAPSIDYVHCNSVELDADGNILISSRHLDEITKIDRTTGDIIWRMGGSRNEFTLIGDTQWFTRQHSVRRTPSGTLTVFDNGNLSTPQESRALEYEIDEGNKTATLVWEYRHMPALYAAFTGSVQRLPNGNTMISWGNLGVVTEARPDGTTAFEMSFAAAGDRTYRAFRFPWTGLAAAPTVWASAEPDSVTLHFTKFGDADVSLYNVYRDSSPEPLTVHGSTAANSYVMTDVVPSDTIYVRVTAEDSLMVESAFSNELRIVIPPTLVAVNLPGAPAGGLALRQNHPNPFAPGTSIAFVLPRVAQADLTVFDVTGRVVRTLSRGETSAGRHELFWDGRDAQGAPAAAGVYFYRLNAGGETVTRKMTLIR